jgi:hypothetical protein
MVHDVISKGKDANRQTTQKMVSQSHRSAAGMSENSSAGFNKLPMPMVKSFALSQDEDKMYLYLESGEVICFDESRSNIIEQLNDFGLA